MAAGRKQLASSAAVAVALVAMLVLVAAAAAQDCGVSRDTMNKCLSYCSSGATPTRAAARSRTAPTWTASARTTGASSSTTPA